MMRRLQRLGHSDFVDYLYEIYFKTVPIFYNFEYPSHWCISSYCVFLNQKNAYFVLTLQGLTQTFASMLAPSGW